MTEHKHAKEYVLTVHARERNPEYKGSTFQAYQPETPEFILSRMLEVTLTEDEWKLVKGAVLEAFP